MEWEDILMSKKLFLTVVTVVLAVTLFAGCTLNDSMQWVSKNKLEQVKQQVKLKIAPDPTDPSKLEIYNFNEPIPEMLNKMLTQTISNIRVFEDFADVPNLKLDGIQAFNSRLGTQIIPEGEGDNITYRLSDEYYFMMYDCELLWTEKTDYIREHVEFNSHHILTFDSETNERIYGNNVIGVECNDYLYYTPISGSFNDIPEKQINFYNIQTNQPLKVTRGLFIEKAELKKALEENKKKNYTMMLTVESYTVGNGAAWQTAIKLPDDLFTIE